MPDTHRVLLEHLDAMAGGDSDPAIVKRLKEAGRSRQLVMLRAVLDRGRTVTSPLPSLDEAWSLLADVQRQDEAAVDAVITHPRTGAWSAQVLRQLGREPDDEPPLWIGLGHLHQMAAAAAIRAGCDFRTHVPVWRGTVMLPTLGIATVPSDDEWSVAEVRGSGGHVVVGGVPLPDDWTSDGPGWLALRVIHVDGWQLWLDDVDPYREFGKPKPPQRLSDSEVTLWTESLRHTWQLLTEHHPAIAAELASGLRTLVPCTSTEPYSASHNDAFGSVLLSLPPDPTTFAATLVHEFQHNKFGVLLSLVDLLDPQADNETPRLYAPWRDDPRPAVGVLHGVVSFLGMTAFYRDQSIMDDRSWYWFEYHRVQTAQGVETLRTGATLSELGQRFLDRVHDRLQKWAVEPVPDDARAAAHRANDEHRESWRLRWGT